MTLKADAFKFETMLALFIDCIYLFFFIVPQPHALRLTQSAAYRPSGLSPAF